jgi:glycosyltransferase involved in cell wall biosynthesis
MSVTNEKLRILHIIYDDCNNPWLGGGGARRTFEIYKRFPAHCEITILTAHYKGAARVERCGNILYKRLGLSFSYPISRITFTFDVARHIRRTPHDVIVEDYSAFSPCFSFFFTKKPVIGSFQNLHSQKAAKGKGFLKALGADLFDSIALFNFRNITPVSPNLASIINKRARFKDNIKFIGVGIDQSLFAVDRSAQSSESSILYIGRIELFQKGIDTLLNAYERLSPRPKLVFAGSGIDLDKLKEMIRERGMEKTVKILGRFSNEEKLDLLKNATILVMPSRFEGYPVVPLEAMASGVAFIGTDIPGTSDITGGQAILVPPENDEELAIGMHSLLTNSKSREEMEQKGKAYARKFEWASISKQYYDFIIHSIEVETHHSS